MARIDFNQLQLLVAKQIGTIPAYRRAAIAEAHARVEEAKEAFMAAFDGDEVTEELEKGPEGATSLLPGGYGNLFSFIGFYDDDKPIDELRAFLERNIRLIETPVTEQFRYIFRVSIPDEREVASITPMPFGTASSWVTAVENGIPGFNRYLFDLEREFAASRSGPAVQTDEAHVLRNSDGYKPQPYLFKKLFPAFRRALLA